MSNVPMPQWSSEPETPRPQTPVEQSLARTDFARPSVSMSTNPELRPLDPEGIPFMTNHEVGAIFGIGPNNSKQYGYKWPITQYKENQSGGDDRNTRTWFSKADVVSHLAERAGAHKAPEERTYEENKFTARHDLYRKELESDRAAVAEQRKVTGIVHNLHNQPIARHKNIHARMEIIPGGRIQTTEGAPAGIELNPSFGSNLENPRKYGHMKPLYDYTDNSDLVQRTSRTQQRGE